MVEQNKNPQTNPAPVQTQSQPTNSGGKKSNVGLIIALVLIGILLILSVGGYFTYRYIKNRVKTAVSDLGTATSSSDESTSSSGTSTGSSYADAKDLTPTGTLLVNLNTEIKPILTTIFGGAKLESWTNLSEDYGYNLYRVKRNSTAADVATLESAILAKGYTKQSASQDETGFMLIFDKGTTTLTIQTALDDAVQVTITKDSSGQ